MGNDCVKAVFAGDATSGLNQGAVCVLNCGGGEDTCPLDSYNLVEEKVLLAQTCEANHRLVYDTKKAESSTRVESLSEQVLLDHLIAGADLERAARLVEAIGRSVDFKIGSEGLEALKYQIAFALGRGLEESDLLKMVHDIALTTTGGERFHDTLATCLVLVCARHYILSLSADTEIKRDTLGMIEFMVPALRKGYISVYADGDTFVDGETSSVLSLPRMDFLSRALSAIETTVHECYHAYQILAPKHSGYTPVKTEIEACKSGYAVQLLITEEISEKSPEDAKRLMEARIAHEESQHESHISKVECIVGSGKLYDKMSLLSGKLRSGIRIRYDSVGLELAGHRDGFADPYVADFVEVAFAMNSFMPVGKGLYQIFGVAPAFSHEECSSAGTALEKYIKRAREDLDSHIATMDGYASDMGSYGNAFDSLVRSFETYSGCIYYTDLNAWNDFSADYVDEVYEGASVLVRKMPLDDKLEEVRNSLGYAGDS